MPPERKKTEQTSTKDGSSAPTVENEPKANGTVADSGQSQDTSAEEPSKKKRKKRKVPLRQRRMVQALGRVEGRILPDENSVKIVTDDGAAFRVREIGKAGLAVRLLGLSDAQRAGRFAFWPSFGKSGIVLVSFNDAEDWVPQEHSPPVDQMFVCGTLHEIEGDSFSVLVGYTARKYSKLAPRILPVGSAPSPEWQSGEWVDLILHRQGQEWLWQGDFHPRGPRVGEQFHSWLPYIEGGSGEDSPQQE